MILKKNGGKKSAHFAQDRVVQILQRQNSETRQSVAVFLARFLPPKILHNAQRLHNADFAISTLRNQMV